MQKSEKHREKDKNVRPPRAGGDPVFNCLDSRLRGNDGYFLALLKTKWVKMLLFADKPTI